MLGTNQNQQMQEMMNQLMPKKKVEREVAVETARKIFTDIYADELIDQESANQEALELAERMGIIFIDEIDKVATNNHNSGRIYQDKVFKEIFYLYLKVALFKPNMVL